MSQKKVTLRFTQKRRETSKAYCFNGVWIPKSIAEYVEQIADFDWRMRVPFWFVEKRNLHNRVVDPDSKAAYSHWNEEAEFRYFSEHPAIFGKE